MGLTLNQSRKETVACVWGGVNFEPIPQGNGRVCVCGGGLTLNQSRKETVACVGEGWGCNCVGGLLYYWSWLRLHFLTTHECKPPYNSGSC